MIERQVDHLVRLVDDLLEMSRISCGKIELRKERVQVASIISNAVETSRPLIEAARHELTVSLPSEPLALEADAVRLSQVLANLLNNAAKYTRAGGRIWVSARRDAGNVLISVRDSGAGIPADLLPRVFDMFFQAQPEARRGGLGIGLTLVKRLVEMHGGTVTVLSKGTGLGSEFLVQLPLAEVGEDASRADNDERNEQCSPEFPLRVLVVDDNRDAADSLAMLLRLQGAEVAVEYNGPSALETLAEFRPQLILLDLGMPQMDGYEVARQIRGQVEYKSICLVALTGWGQPDDRRRSTSVGFDHHLLKPVNLRALKSILSAICTQEPSAARLEKLTTA
jgi:CheY-like chemotaxis protein/two-component sensor histidine kinase